MLHLLGNSSAPFSWDSVRDAWGRGNRGFGFFFFVSAAAVVSVRRCFHPLLVLQRKLQVSLLRYTRETRLSAQQAAGGHAVHGPETAARPAEAEVNTFWDAPRVSSRLFRRFPSAFSRFKPVQKFDSCSGENYSGGGQTHPGAAEQTVIAQRQHHQQFLGQSESFRPHTFSTFYFEIHQLRA